MIFRQLFEPVSSTYTYLLGCEATGQALLIDAVMPTWERDLTVVNELGLSLVDTVDTHFMPTTSPPPCSSSARSVAASSIPPRAACRARTSRSTTASSLRSVAWKLKASTPPATPTTTSHSSSKDASSPATHC